MSQPPLPRQEIGILGAGSFGTALALLLQSNGHGVTVWSHRAETAKTIAQARENAVYLPGVSLPAEIRFTGELEQLRGSQLLLLVTPSKAMREISARLAGLGLPEETILLSCTKGVERGTGLRMSEVVAEHFPRNPLAVLSGPSHAEEVALGRPTAVVIGCAEAALGRTLQEAFSTRAFRAYTSEDVAGIELGGALKNIFALAAGVSDGLGLGDNAKAALVTRSLAELIRLGCALGGRRETFQGLSGIGDLMVTCFSQHSRNRKVGHRLGRGETLEGILSSMTMVAEGVPTTFSALECARQHGLEAPIVEQINALLTGAVSAKEGMARLLGRELKAE